MTSSSPLDIKVLYPLTAGARGVVRSTPRTALPARAGGARRLGLLNLAAAFVLYYLVWWQVDPFIYRTLIMKTPIPGLDLTRAPGMLQSAGAENGALGSGEPSGPRISGLTAVKTMGAVSYLWLGATTTAAFALALASGAGLGVRIGPAGRRQWIILCIGALLALLWTGYVVLSRYGWKYPPDHLRWWIGGAALLTLLVGMTIGARSRRPHRVAAALLLASACGSAVGLYLWGQCGALDAVHHTWWFILFVFLIHSSYGWVLWSLSARWAR
jgi:hypothetical protein